MRVVHLSTRAWAGGAARAAYRLHQSLLAAGHDSSMITLSDVSTDPAERIGRFEPVGTWWASKRRAIRSKWLRAERQAIARSVRPGYDLVTDTRTVHAEELLRCIPDCDVINLHWVTGLIDWEAFLPKAAVRWPIVWTLHDMNAFTGGCHYDAGCGNFANSCGTCPILNSESRGDATHSIWLRKRRAYRKVESLHIATPSKWLAQQVARSSLLRDRPTSVIPYGLDSAAYRPLDRQAVRRALGIPTDARTVLFVAESLGNRRKGFDLLCEAISHLRGFGDLYCLSLGRSAATDVPGLKHLHLGYVDGEIMQAMAYNAADLFVIPSREDNLPNTVLEAMACGTPVVGFDTGGIQDMVRSGQTGLLVRTGDVVALADAIRRLLQDDGMRRVMSGNCRGVAEKEFSLERQASAYTDLYRRVIEDHRKTRNEEHA